MKKLLVVCTLVMASYAAFAQPQVTSAYNANKNGDYEKAVEYIDEAITTEKGATKEKTWRYRGDIYLNVANTPELAAKFPNAVKTAAESYKKAMELDTKNSYINENRQQLAACQAMAMNGGIAGYNDKNFAQAANMFDLGVEIATMLEFTDTLAYYNAALAHEQAGNLDNAIKNYEKCGELGYNVPNVYLFISNIYQKQGNRDEAINTIKSARERFPDDPGLIIEELNIYLQDGNFENAQKNLQLAIQNDPENAVLHFSIGSVYDNLGKKEEAVAAYAEALRLNPEYFDANYNMGALYFNKAVEMVNKANDIPPTQNAKYKAAMDEANVVFEQALPFLEKSYQLNDTDEGTLRSLKDIYIRLGKDDKYNEIKEKLEGK